MTTSQGTNNQQYSSVSNPWAPTQGALTGIVNNLGGVNYAPTQQQNQAYNGLYSSASGIPNFGPTIGNVASGYLSGQNNTGINNAAANATSALSPYLSPNYLNPATNPGEQSLINTITQQTLNNVNGQFAGSGRDMSPANSQAAALGLSQGLANPLFNQYNANVGAQQGAAGDIFNIANQANQAYLQNAGFGVNTAGGVPGAYTAPGQTQLGVANTGYQMPLSNVGDLTNLLLPIAGLGGQVSGNQNTQTSYTPSPLSVGQSFMPSSSWFSAPFGGATPATNFLSLLGFGQGQP